MNTLLKNSLIVLLLINCLNPALSQDKRALNKQIQQADISFYYDKDYLKAASLYEPIYNAYPENSNLAAKLGICYLNIEGKKMDALLLLEKASKNVVNERKDYNEYGEQAPLDTYMYLALAYHANDSLEKAVSQYNLMKKRLSDSEVFTEEYIDNQIRNCRYAMEMKKKPVRVLSDLFAPWLSDYPGACNPVLAKNDSVFIFTQKTEDKTRILCSWKGKEWEKPRDITRQLGGYDRLYSNSITGDGKTLVLFMDDGDDGNLYFSQRRDTVWSRIRNFGRPVNTIYWESHGFITPDANSIYIASNRPGGFGELDLWVSEKKPDGSWDNPVNLGERINTPYNEDTPFFDPDNEALIFSSDGHVSMGDYDVFRSVIRAGNWTNPVAMPYAFNTTAANTSFILNNNAPGFVASIYDDKSEERNIYAIVGVDPADELTTAEGSVTLADGMQVEPSKAQLRLTDAAKGTLIKTVPLNNDGTFKFDFKPGEYKLYVSHEGYENDTISLSLPLYFLSQYMAVNSKLTPVETGESFLAITNILFEFDKYDLNSEARSALEAVKSILVNHPDLKIEVAGYTDAKGSVSYNLTLADKRAQAVIDYLTSPAIPASRFTKKSFGKSNFAAINTNSDGSDNPEGRKYNRRVTFGIVDPKTGIVLRQETYTPEHLRMASATKYSVVLLENAQRLSPGYFAKLDLGGMLFLKSFEEKSLYMYSVGIFYNNADATQFLLNVKDKGFTDAYVINQADLNDITKLKRTEPAFK
ncbi:MAG TPA: OmpA family protein [Bacteroidales bacterium]|jgi:outer membrane protein OmpA-like peptidoglycan-associated protein|nr:OmpA family protein [Bacteroidales bacterium]HQB37302.1 OmpA family protein [Bacteroidales bacterium]